MSRNILVFGGNGYLGQEICKQALLKGLTVHSASRGGNPPKIKGLDGDWVNHVQWHRADLKEPSSYMKQLKKMDHIVHSVGILFEHNYKPLLSSPMTEVPKVLMNQLKNPRMAPTPEMSYEAINHRSATSLYESVLDTVKATNRSVTFTYVSAESTPLSPPGYIESKSAAEEDILSHKSPLVRPIILRPGFMSPAGNDSHIMAFPDNRSMVGNILGLCSVVTGCKSLQPISVTKVAAKAVTAMLDPKKQGVISLEELRN